MHRAVLAFTLLAFASLVPAGAEIQRAERGALVLENVPEIPAELTARLDQYQNTRAATLAGWLPDGSVLIATRFGDTNQFHRVRQPMGAREQLTFFPEPLNFAAVSPDRARNGFVYLRDVGGNEFFQLYWFDLGTRESRLLTDGSSRNSLPVWSNRGNRFAYSSTRRDGRNHDLYVATPDGDHISHRLVHQAEGLWMPLDWAPGDGRLLVAHYLSINESRIFVLDLASGELTQVNAQDMPVGYGMRPGGDGAGAAAFDRSGTGVYLVHDHGSEFKQLHHLDLRTGHSRPLSAQIPWDVSGMTLSRDRSHMAFVANEGGRSRLHLLELRRERPLATPELPVGLIGAMSFNLSGTALALTVSTPSAPDDIYVYEPRRRALTRWTESEVGGLDTTRFPVPELVSFRSFDGLEVPAWVYRPDGPGPHPVIIQIHGGPESQSRPGFFAQFASWSSELGAAVIRPNVRGSAGYGKSYLQLDNGALREDSVRDIGALLDWIGGQPDLDAGRVVVYGGSYGGYMVLASLVHFDERLLGGVSRVGISNFVSFLENTEAYRRDLRRAEYGDERDPEMRAHLERISPLNNASRITSPLFVAQGRNDPRVPYTESEQIVRAVRGNGVAVWYMLAMNEGHGLARKANRDYFEAATVMFIRELFRAADESSPAQ
jgi:dipeptidyl aminopeptidase/acylaminoacyl peptidase